MKTEIEGYIIQKQEGSYYLGKEHFWYVYNDLNETWVHPEGELEDILIQSMDWPIKPNRLIPAIYKPEKRMVFTSEPLNIEGLNSTEILELIRGNQGETQ